MPSEQIRAIVVIAFQIRVRSCRYETVPASMPGHADVAGRRNIGLTDTMVSCYSFVRAHLTAMTHRLTTPLRTHRVRLEAKALLACARASRPASGGVIPTLPTANSADRMRGA